MRTAGSTRGVAPALAGAVLAVLASGVACGRSGAAPVAPAPRPDLPGPASQPPVEAAPDAPARSAPEGPRAVTRWLRVLDENAASVQLASGGDGSVVAVTRGPGEARLGAVTLQLVDAGGRVLWKRSRVPACPVDVRPLRSTSDGVLLITRAWCDDPLPGFWPVAVGPASFIVLGDDGGLRRLVTIGFAALAESDATGALIAAEDRESTGALTLRKRAADGTVVWQRTGLIGTKVALDLAASPDGGAYVFHTPLLTRLRSDGSSMWTRRLPVLDPFHGEAELVVLEDGAIATTVEAPAGTMWGSGTVERDGTAVLVTDADGSPRTARSAPGALRTEAFALPAFGVGLITHGESGGRACTWIEALGPRLEPRWARRVDEGCASAPQVAAVTDPAAGTLALGAIMGSHADFGEGAVVDPAPGTHVAVLVSVDATPGAATDTPPPAAHLDPIRDVPATGPGSTEWARDAAPCTRVADARDGTAVVTAQPTRTSLTLSRVDAAGGVLWSRTFDGRDCLLEGAVAGVTAAGGIVLSLRNSCPHAVPGLGDAPPGEAVLLDRDGAFVRRLAVPAPSHGGQRWAWHVDADGGLILEEVVGYYAGKVLSKADGSGTLLWSHPEQLGDVYAPVVPSAAGGVVVLDGGEVRRIGGGGEAVWRTPLGVAPSAVTLGALRLLRDGAVAVTGRVSRPVSFGAGAAGPGEVLWLVEPDGRPRGIVPLGLATDRWSVVIPLRDGGVAVVGGYGCPRMRAFSFDGGLRWDRVVDRPCEMDVQDAAGLDGTLLLSAIRWSAVDLGSGVTLDALPLGAYVLAAIEP